MNDQSQSSIEKLILCCSCHAACPADAKTCWLCAAPFSGSMMKTSDAGAPPGEFQSTDSVKVALIVTSLILCIVAGGVFMEAPGIGVLLFIVAASTMIALGKGLKVKASAHANSGAVQAAYTESAMEARVARQNRVLKIVLIVLSSIVTALLSVIIIAILSVIALVSAIISFLESCFELLQPPC